MGHMVHPVLLSPAATVSAPVSMDTVLGVLWLVTAGVWAVATLVFAVVVVVIAAGFRGQRKVLEHQRTVAM